MQRRLLIISWHSLTIKGLSSADHDARMTMGTFLTTLRSGSIKYKFGDGVWVFGRVTKIRNHLTRVF